jgi:hypothetical protein
MFTFRKESSNELEDSSVPILDDDSVTDEISPADCWSGPVEDDSSPQAMSISDRVAAVASIFFMMASFF